MRALLLSLVCLFGYALSSPISRMELTRAVEVSNIPLVNSILDSFVKPIHVPDLVSLAMNTVKDSDTRIRLIEACLQVSHLSTAQDFLRPLYTALVKRQKNTLLRRIKRGIIGSSPYGREVDFLIVKTRQQLVLDGDGMTLLMLAVSTQNVDLVKYLVSLPTELSSLGSTDSSGLTVKDYVDIARSEFSDVGEYISQILEGVPQYQTLYSQFTNPLQA